MIFTHRKILFLLIAFSAIEKDFVFAENSTLEAKAPINSGTSSTSIATTTRPTSSKTTSAPPKLSTVSSAPVKSNNLSTASTASTATTVPSVTSSPELSLNDTKGPVDFIIVEEDEPLLTDDIDIIKNFHYVIYDEKTKVPCLLTKMGITLTVPYETEDNTIATTIITVPLDANATGTCDENLSLITLAWQETDNLQETISDGENSLTMRFKKDGDIFYVQYLVVSVTLDIANFPNATGSTVSGNSSYDLKLFPAPVQLGMHICNETKDVQVDPILVQFYNMSVIAFNNETDFSGKKEAFCASDDEDAGTNENTIIGAIIGGVLGCIIFLGIIIFIVVKRSVRNSSSWNILRKRKIHEGC